jgi:cyclopropane-fatty-acyl-phospholipid synthase
MEVSAPAATDPDQGDPKTTVEGSQMRAHATARAQLQLVSDYLSRLGPAAPGIRMWDGSVWSPTPDGDKPMYTLVINSPFALRRTFLRPDAVSLSEAFNREDIEIEGDLLTAMQGLARLRDLQSSFTDRLRLFGRIKRLPKGESTQRPNPWLPEKVRPSERSRQKQAISYHYDHPVDFWSAWLDPRLLYTCAYFPHSTRDHPLDRPELSLAVAQERKLELVCRKLDLQEGDRLLDIGCGWGGMAVYAGRRHGARVLGVTLSQPQADCGNRMLAEAGLAESCRLEVRDYRDLPTTSLFDKISGLGVVEHVARGHLSEYFDHVASMLKPGGLFVNQGISCGWKRGTSRGRSFIDTYVFPDFHLVPIQELLSSASAAGLDIRHVEDLRAHYPPTLAAWRRNLHANREHVQQIVGKSAYRTFDLYLAATEHAFMEGTLGIYQCVFQKPRRDGAPEPAPLPAWYAGLPE